jgi:molybdate transport system substrate-binding protein
MRAFLLAASLAVILAPAAQAADIRVVTPGFVGLGGIKDLAEKFSTETGNKVTVDVQGMGAMMDTVKAGGDVVVLPVELMDDATKQNLVVANTRQKLARVEIVMIVPAGAKHPDISTVAKTAAAIKGAKQIAYSNPFTAEKSQQAMLIYNLLQRPDFQPNNGKPPAKGNAVVGIKEGADMGLQLHSQINDPAVEYVGNLPVELGMFLDGDIAVSAKATDAKLAAQFIAFLKSPASVAYFKSRGLDPR